MTVDLTPLSRLRVRSPRLELRLPAEGELVELARLASDGIHDPASMPFAVAWSDRANEPTFTEEFVDYHLTHRRSWSPGKWSLELGVWEHGRPVGVQGMLATSFAACRRVETGSWLGARHQGRGLGTEMRAAMLTLAFDGLGAAVATSGALDGNEVSARVSAKLGYETAGERTVAPRGTPVRERVFELTRERWASMARPDVTVSGLDECLPLFGLDPPS